MIVVESSEDEIQLVFKREEIVTLSNALNEISNGPEAIPDWEFQTRVGASRAEALALLSAMSALIQSDRIVEGS